MKAYIIIYLIVILLCVILSAFYSASEICFAKINSIKLNRNYEKAISKNNKTSKDKKTIDAYCLKNDYEKLIGTILIGNNLVNILASSLATLVFTSYYPNDGATISTIVMTIVILIFGEILPKTILSKYSYDVSLNFAPILKVMEKIFFIIVYPVNKLIKLLNKLYTPKEEDDIVDDDDELHMMAQEIEEDGFIDEDTQELLDNAIDFVDVMAYEIMTPRVDLVSYDKEDNIIDFTNDPEFYKYSRIPVYEDTIDNIIGYINTNEILKLKLRGEEIKVDELINPVIYVHKTKTISQVLKEFKKKKIHFAVVIDEFGGTLGLVTLEDIIEELVGEIFDETDDIEVPYEKINKNLYIVDGDLNIDDLFDLFDIEYEDFESEYSTVGGFITEKLERFPKVEDKVKYNNFRFRVLKVDGVRIEKIEVKFVKSKNK